MTPCLNARSGGQAVGIATSPQSTGLAMLRCSLYELPAFRTRPAFALDVIAEAYKQQSGSKLEARPGLSEVARGSAKYLTVCGGYARRQADARDLLDHSAGLEE